MKTLNLLQILALSLFAYSCNEATNKASNNTPNLEVNEALLDSVYGVAMAYYDKKDYKKSAKNFDLFFEQKGNLIFNNGIYNAACTYALNNEDQKALQWLKYVIEEKFYSNLDHIKTDSDLKSLHQYPNWQTLLESVQENIDSAPKRNREAIKTELFKAKEILTTDNGKLWNLDLWSSKILVIDYDNTIYSLEKLDGSETKDSILFYTKFKDNELSFTNTTQDYKGTKYATVMIHSLKDNSATIIHELFHLAHFNINTNLKANPIPYLDKFDARLLLRVEYQALKNALQFANENADANTVASYVTDALIMRKIRQTKYRTFLDEEIELETVEGLANYTGIKMSTVSNKYKRAIDEINEREAADTYTRPFPYATGPAYGLLFDYLKMDWRLELNKVYNYLEVYENQHLEDTIPNDENTILEAKQRNNYKTINTEETQRKIEFDKLTDYYTNLLITQPTLKVSLIDNMFSMSFNMNGTLILDDYGIVYSGIKGTDLSGENFGSFHIISGKDRLGDGGILKLKDAKPTTYVFPIPSKIEENKIYGDFYEIELNEGWHVEKIKGSENMEIIKN